MNETERELWEALMELVCCPAFNGQVFERDRESHRAWTLAKDVLERHRPLPTEERERRGIRLDELPTGGQGQVLKVDEETKGMEVSHEIGPVDRIRCSCGTVYMRGRGECPFCKSPELNVPSTGLVRYTIKPAEGDDIPDFLKRQAE